MLSTWQMAALGGLMIGAASALLLLTHGRLAGISGIASGVLRPAVPDRAWRMAFLGGLVVAGGLTALLAPGAIGGPISGPGVLIAAGLLVGFGAGLANGCTSGHGVCGIARRSPRSMVAVITFMTTGVLTAMIAGQL